MTLTQAIEYIKKYSELEIDDRKKCLRYDGAKIIAEATKVIEDNGAAITEQDRELLKVYLENIQKGEKELADNIKELSKEKHKTGVSLLSVLERNKTTHPVYKELLKAFKLGRRDMSMFKFLKSKGKPKVLFQYNKLSVEARKALEESYMKRYNESDTIKQINEKQKEIDELEKAGAITGLNSAKKSESLKNQILDLQEKSDKELNEFGQFYGDFIVAGRAIANTKKLERVCKGLEKAPKLPPSHEEESEEDMDSHVYTEEERARMEEERKERIAEIYENDRDAFIKETKNKMDNGDNIPMEDYYKYNQYKAYREDMSALNGIKERLDKNEFDSCNRRFSMIKQLITNENIEKINEFDLKILAGMSPGEYKKIREREYDNIFGEEAVDEYLDENDLHIAAEKAVDGEEDVIAVPAEEAPKI